MCKLACLEAQIRSEQTMQQINYLWIWHVQIPNKQALWFRVMNQLRPNPWGSVLICVSDICFESISCTDRTVSKIKVAVIQWGLRTNVHMQRACTQNTIQYLHLNKGVQDRAFKQLK